MTLTKREDFGKLDTETLFALCLYNEAGGESTQGVEAVAEVIMNRAGRNSANVKAVILQPLQFSWLNADELKAIFSARSAKAIQTPGALDKFRAIARRFLTGQMTNHTQGAKFYLNENTTRKIRSDGSLPAWFYNLQNRIRIGNHTFGSGYFDIKSAIEQTKKFITENPGTTAAVAITVGTGIFFLIRSFSSSDKTERPAQRPFEI